MALSADQRRRSDPRGCAASCVRALFLDEAGRHRDRAGSLPAHRRGASRIDIARERTGGGDHGHHRAAAGGMKPSILIVDDDETIRETLAEFFSALDLPVRAAATATEGRRAIAAHSPDVALVDLRLPDADGLTLLEAIRA